MWKTRRRCTGKNDVWFTRQEWVDEYVADVQARGFGASNYATPAEAASPALEAWLLSDS